MATSADGHRLETYGKSKRVTDERTILSPGGLWNYMIATEGFSPTGLGNMPSFR